MSKRRLFHTMEAIFYLLLIYVVVSCHSNPINHEYFSATIQLQKLLHTQKILINTLDNFIRKEDLISIHLQTFRDNLQRENNIAHISYQKYVENPINTFKLLKRLTIDLQRVLENIELLGPDIPLRLFPTEKDLVGTSQTMVLLQETYQLKTVDLARGFIHNEQYSSPLTTSDCFSLGRVLHDNGLHYHSNQWFLMVLEKLKSEETPSHTARKTTMQYIAFNNYEMGDTEEGLVWLDKIIEDYLIDAEVSEIKNEWQAELLERRKNNKTTRFKDDKAKKEYNVPKSSENIATEALCRGERLFPLRLMNSLVCRFDNTGHPYLKLAPFKVEEIFLEPDIFIYHDVIKDSEIERIKKLSIRKLERAAIYDLDNEGKAKAKVIIKRVSQVSWLEDADDEVVARLSRRAGYIARLNIRSSEDLQANIYGIGGHFTPHYDVSLNPSCEDEDVQTKRRIATVMFYMSDVKSGGFTIFTKLGIAVKPKKGSAVVWRNLLPSSEPDLHTKHAGCPVLLGSKWVLNKWFHTFGQEFIAPCGLEYQRQEEVNK